MMPPTELIHLTYDGNFELECEAKVVGSKKLEGDDAEIYLDKTTMHPQGGGQPTDVGTISAGDQILNVTKVTVDRATGIVTHAGKVTQAAEQCFEVGADVKVSVDGNTRMILSECHTAGHVVDSAMARCDRVLPPSKGYHFLDGPYVEYKGKIPPEEKETLLPRLQQAFQELVEEDIPTKIETMERTAAEEACYRLQENVDLSEYGEKEIRIVTVAGWPCPCGGTHVKSTSLLKERKWGITGIKAKKGMVRIKYGQNVEL